jgi:two-component system sensor histidine kinase KdpD
MSEDRAASFLQMIRRSQRGRLKIYLGYGPGVGKTYQMLLEGHRLKKDGIDVVVGLVETHNRPETMQLVDGLDVVSRRKVEYRGITIEEMDVDAVLARKPQVALVDELAHTNAPDSRNQKRYQDVQELLAAGIHVISTMNVQHMESLYNTVEKLLGVKVRERVPDSVVADADQVVNIDLAAEDLQRRLEEGKVYPKDRAMAALQNFFTHSNLEHLRELTLREVASQLDFRRREQKTPDAKASGADQVMVCLSSRGPNSARLLRYGSRLAGRLNRNWYAIYVQTPKEEPTVIDARVQRLLADTLTLANELGAVVLETKGQDVTDTILRFAREYRVANIIIGRPRRLPWWRRLIGERSVAEELIHRAEGLTVIVVDVEAVEEEPTMELPSETLPPQPTKAVVTTPAAPPPKKGQTIGEMLTPQRIVIWDDPASKADIFRRMAAAIANGDGTSADTVVQKLEERERTGSTFLNEGVALPHARVDGLTEPQIAIGLTHEGVLDAPTEKPIEVVFMLLSPAVGANAHLQLLAKAGRLLQARELRRRLSKAASPQGALEEIRSWEGSNSRVEPATTR